MFWDLLTNYFNHYIHEKHHRFGTSPSMSAGRTSFHREAAPPGDQGNRRGKFLLSQIRRTLKITLDLLSVQRNRLSNGINNSARTISATLNGYTSLTCKNYDNKLYIDRGIPVMWTMQLMVEKSLEKTNKIDLHIESVRRYERVSDATFDDHF